jgi:hypothetical protein
MSFTDMISASSTDDERMISVGDKRGSRTALASHHPLKFRAVRGSHGLQIDDFFTDEECDRYVAIRQAVRSCGKSFVPLSGAMKTHAHRQTFTVGWRP